LPANLRELYFIGNSLTIQLEYDQNFSYENIWLCLKQPNICIKQLDNRSVNNSIQLNISDYVNHGESYVFFLNTTGCKGDCVEESNNITIKSGKFLIKN
jgi:hypothetical protein